MSRSCSPNQTSSRSCHHLPLGTVFHITSCWLRQLALARPTTGRCPTDCPITSMLWVLLVPLRRNYGKQNARQSYSYQVDFELKIGR